jgi:hypothetical protein
VRNKVIAFVAAVVVVCIALGVTLTLVLDHQRDEERRSRCRGTLFQQTGNC